LKEKHEMSPKKRNSICVRRTPRQQRSGQTIKVIFEVTARLVESQGIERLTTAHIAEVAGYGVGTIYDYFPDGTVILIAMARQELNKVVSAVQKSLIPSEETKNTTATQRAMRALIQGFGER